MARRQFTCSTCGDPGERNVGEINRAVRLGRPLFCSRACFQITRRVDEAEKKRKSVEYHTRYRTEKPTPHEYWANYYQQHRAESIAAAQDWYANNREHVAEKGKLRRARRFFGDFAEAYLVWLELDREIARRVPDKYERLKARGCYARYNENKKERRRRNYA